MTKAPSMDYDDKSSTSSFEMETYAGVFGVGGSPVWSIWCAGSRINSVTVMGMGGRGHIRTPILSLGHHQPPSQHHPWTAGCARTRGVCKGKEVYTPHDFPSSIRQSQLPPFESCSKSLSKWKVWKDPTEWFLPNTPQNKHCNELEK